jgi:hypothetical protein
MEPFITTAFDGPQHDDTLLGQRFYGDVFEDDDDTANSNPLGLLSLGSILVLEHSIDDDTDSDFYSFSVGSPNTRVVVRIDPFGFSYEEAPQSGSCPSSGPILNTEALGNLGVELIDSNGSTVLISRNALPAGYAEEFSYVIPTISVYYTRVFGVSDNVQMYDLTVTLPPNSVRDVDLFR